MTTTQQDAPADTAATDPAPKPESEFDHIFIGHPWATEFLARPPKVQASKKLIRMIADAQAEHDTPERFADWVADLMERYGARSAQGCFFLEDDSGPRCSWCTGMWPLCGHHHLSEEISTDEDDDGAHPTPTDAAPAATPPGGPADMSTPKTANVTVYTREGCVQCNATTRDLKKAGIEYALIDLTHDEAAAEALRREGHQQMPVVVTENETWTGYRPDLIKAYARLSAAAAVA